MIDDFKLLRCRASRLYELANSGDPQALGRMREWIRPARKIQMSDALHAIATEAGFANWPKLKFANDARCMDRASRVERLKIALFLGQHWVVDRLLAADSELKHENLGLELALYDKKSVFAQLEDDPEAATRIIGVRNPILHLCFSRHIHSVPHKAGDVIDIAEKLVNLGASVNDSYPAEPGSEHRLSALYGALGHAANLPLARWLLEKGADPDDNESLYHATELGHGDGVSLLLDHGARVDGTNALLRALDFNDHQMVKDLLAHGANPNEEVSVHPSGALPVVITAIHQAARRLCDERMACILLDAGADPDDTRFGHTAYATARVFGNLAMAKAIDAYGGCTDLDAVELQLASAADETDCAGYRINVAELPEETRHLLTEIIRYPNRLRHAQRLVELGFEIEGQDKMGMTPLHVAGWEGLADVMEWLLSLGSNLKHINGFGGTLLSTIVHGSENCPARASRKHIACARMALQAGVPLPIPCIEFAGEEDMAGFLVNWAEDHPEQVIEDGIG